MDNQTPPTTPNETGTSTIPAPPEPAVFKLGFADYANAHPEVGTPRENEHEFGPNYQAQMTTNGMLFYSKDANGRPMDNGVQFAPK